MNFLSTGYASCANRVSLLFFGLVAINTRLQAPRRIAIIIHDTITLIQA
jgi:hypothetical protein